MRILTLCRNKCCDVSKEALWALTNLITCGSKESNQEILNIEQTEAVQVLIDYLSVVEGMLQ